MHVPWSSAVRANDLSAPHRDAPRRRPPVLGQPDGQHAVAVVGPCARLVDVHRQRQGTLEPAVRPLGDVVAATPLLAGDPLLPADDQDAVDELDLDRLRLEAGYLDPGADLVVVLAD